VPVKIFLLQRLLDQRRRKLRQSRRDAGSVKRVICTSRVCLGAKSIKDITIAE